MDEFLDLIKTDSNFTHAKVDFDSSENNLKIISTKIKTVSSLVLVSYPVISKTTLPLLEEDISDYTAAIIAGAVDARNCRYGPM
jgi:aspartokinase/homoserine dehydrogenase 1